jgi:hypothetical protein
MSMAIGYAPRTYNHDRKEVECYLNVRSSDGQNECQDNLRGRPQQWLW